MLILLEISIGNEDTFFEFFSGSSNGHSPVLNLSKTAGSGSVGEHSGSEAGASHRSQDDEEEDDNLSEDLEDDNEKDEGIYLFPLSI